MKKYIHKPTLIDAEQFHGFYRTPYPEGVQVEENRCYVTTAHGQRVYLEEGDWIAREPNNRGYYPIKPDIFVKNYDEFDI